MNSVQFAFRMFRKQWKYNVFIILELSLLISLSLAFFNFPVQLILFIEQFTSFFRVDQVESDAFFYVCPSFFIFLAIIACIIFFLRNLIHIKTVENIEEIRKLKQNGYTLSQISRLYFIETTLSAISAGILAIVMGEFCIQMMEYQLKLLIFPEGNPVPFHFLWIHAFSYTNILGVFGIALLYSYLISHKVVTRILRLKIDQSRSSDRFNPEWSPGFQFIFRHIIEISLLTAFPVFFIWLMDRLNIDLLDTLFDFSYFIGLILAMILTPVFCILFPLFIAHFSLKLLFRVLESKLKTSSPKLSPKLWHIFYTLKSLARQKYQKYHRFIFLILTFNLLIFSVNYQQIENDYYDRKELHLMGDGQFARLHLTQGFNQSTVEEFSHYMESYQSELQFSQVFRYDYILNLSYYDAPAKLNWSQSGVVIDYDMYESIPDEWFIDTTYQQIKTRAKQENFVICPSIFKTLGYRVGDSLNFSFSNGSFDYYSDDPSNSSNVINMTLPIEGFYYAFPLIDILTIPNCLYSEQLLFHNSSLFSQVPVVAVYLLFTYVYMESINFYSLLSEILDNQSILYIQYVEYQNPAIVTWNGYFGLPTFLLERIFSRIIYYFLLVLLGVVLLNLLISLYLDHRTFLPESRFLYSRGASKTHIFSIYLLQFLFYGFLALILAWCSLGPLHMLMTLRNILASPRFPQFERYWQVNLGASISILAIVFGSYTALFLLNFLATRKSFYRIEKQSVL